VSDPIKLKAEGDRHAMKVARCRKLPFGKRPELEFEGEDGSKVWMPEPSALRQLGNLSLTVDSVVGRRITIKRDPNKTDATKPYWGIYLEDGESGAKVNGSGPASAGKAGASTSGGGVATALPTQPPTQPAKPEKDSALYLRMTEFVLTDVKNLYETHGYQMPAEVAAACVQTLYIQAKR
jgi:hypothetical protein